MPFHSTSEYLLQRVLPALPVFRQPAIHRLAVQAKRGGHILWMSAFPDLINCPDQQRLKSLMIEFPAIVIPHGRILPDHKIKVELLSNSLVRRREPGRRRGGRRGSSGSHQCLWVSEP